MEFSLKPILITSKKNNKQYQAYSLVVGDFQKLIFPVGRMETNYLAKVIGDGISCEISEDE